MLAGELGKSEDSLGSLWKSKREPEQYTGNLLPLNFLNNEF